MIGRTHKTIGLELSGGEARLVVASSRRGEPATVEAAVECPATVEALSAAILHARAAGCDLLAAWAPSASRLGHHWLETPVLSDQELPRFVERQLRKSASLEPGQVLGVASLGAGAATDRNTLEVLAVAAPASELQAVLALLAALPARPRLLTSAPLGLVRLSLQLSAPSSAVALAQVTARSCVLAIAEGGRLRFSRELDASLLGAAGEGEVASVLAEELARTVRYFQQRQQAQRLEKLVVFGPPALLSPMLPDLAGRLPFPIEAGQVPGLRANGVGESALRQSGIAVGLALGEAAPKAIDLLPPGLRTRIERRWLLGGAAALVLLGASGALGALRLELNSAASAEHRRQALSAQLAQLNQKLTEGQAQAQELGRLDAWSARFAGLNAYHARFGQLLTGLANAAPASLVVSSLKLQAEPEGTHVRVVAELAGSDPGALQGDVHAFVQAISAIPGVRALTLAPLVIEPGAGDALRVKPQLDFQLDAPWPFACEGACP